MATCAVLMWGRPYDGVVAITEIEAARTPVERRRAFSMREWLAPPIVGSPLWGWLGPLLVTVFAGFLRFDRLAIPKQVVFDETYYAKDALALLKFGWEHNTVKDADKLLIQQGTDANIWGDGPSFVAHPPAGKWMIAIGEQLFGATPFGWRFMPALAGTLSVLILCRVARRMTGSTLLGCAAGLLLAVDGLAFVTSRTALLDVFVMFWVLAAFACLVADRDRSRRLLATRLGAQEGFGFGPFVMHWWRIPAGLCLGLACATKWTGIFYVVAFGLMALLWDMGARKASRIERPYSGAVLLDGIPAFFSMVVLAGVTYLASWWGWIFKPGGWGRGEVSGNVLARPFEALPDLWNYHKEILNFHNKLDTAHTYQSWPWDWPVLRRPVAFYYTEPNKGCGEAGRCSREILGIGTPVFWWGALIALVVVACVWLVRRDWRAGAITLGFLAGWAPWFPSALGDRTMFLFYATPLLPFMALAVTLALGMLIGPARPPEAAKALEPDPALGLAGVTAAPALAGGTDETTDAESTPGPAGARRVLGAAIAGAYLLMVLANFAYFYPILAAKVIPYEEWHARIWFDTWI